MNTIFKRKFFAIISIFALLFVGSSCEDNIGIVVTEENPNADKTLYEVIMNDKDLTDFVEVLNACNIPSPKDPTVITSVADSLFNTSRVYTVWAPVNGFNKDSIIERINKGYREDVMKTFVGAHVANFLKPAKGRFEDKGESVLMLNEKKFIFKGSYDKGYTFGGKKLCDDVNNRAKNGILHKLESISEYNYNIWEYIGIYANAPESYFKVDSVVNYLYSYNDSVFSEYLSIPGPIVDRKQTYIEEVYVYENKLLSKYGGVGNLNDEDSVYTFYLPTNDVWDEMLAQAEKHFNYLVKQGTDTALVDSLKEYYAKYNFIKYLTYSEKEQRYVNSADSVMPAQQEYSRKCFAKADLEKCVVENKELSNGTLKVVNKFPYSMFDLWHDTIKIEAEDTKVLENDLTENFANYFKESKVSEDDLNPEVGSKVSNDRFVEFGATTNQYTHLSYYLPNVKSATYKIALVTVPKNVYDADEKLDSARLNCKVFAWVPEKNQIDSIYEVKGFVTDSCRIDTLILPKYITFPFCEYNLTSDVEKLNTKILIEGFESRSSNYSNTIRLDAILLIPVEDQPLETPDEGGSEGNTPDEDDTEGNNPDEGGSEGNNPDEGGTEGNNPGEGGTEENTPDEDGTEENTPDEDDTEDDTTVEGVE